MGELLGGLIALLMWLLIIPIIILALVFGLAAAGVGIAIALAATILSIAVSVIWSALPFLLIVGVLYLIFRPSSRSRDVAPQ